MGEIKYINDLYNSINILETILTDKLILKQYEEATNIQLEIDYKKELLEKCKDNLDKLSRENIGSKIYLNILNGMNPTKAVESVAEYNYLNDIKPCSISSIWAIYKKVKKALDL